MGKIVINQNPGFRPVIPEQYKHMVRDAFKIEPGTSKIHYSVSLVIMLSSVIGYESFAHPKTDTRFFNKNDLMGWSATI
ncbi:hypothetical protein GCM10007390_31680 [Persicitalea jodogahamensis]|uniref:Uncharacterized protein n=1 Tax=Persicitalea jodogahamensis TaxID=402147 RepID=A0A8J3GAP3_9BACT|nr:hypothetical protein GCM10007390_31680 [Persicitalea jodogahamensis]